MYRIATRFWMGITVCQQLEQPPPSVYVVWCAPGLRLNIRHIPFSAGSCEPPLTCAYDMYLMPMRMTARRDEPVCAAILRVFGRSVAELPLVATRQSARRQGHCRALMHCVQVRPCAAAAAMIAKYLLLQFTINF